MNEFQSTLGMESSCGEVREALVYTVTGLGNLTSYLVPLIQVCLLVIIMLFSDSYHDVVPKVITFRPGSAIIKNVLQVENLVI